MSNFHRSAFLFTVVDNDIEILTNQILANASGSRRHRRAATGDVTEQQRMAAKDTTWTTPTPADNATQGGVEVLQIDFKITGQIRYLKYFSRLAADEDQSS